MVNVQNANKDTIYKGMNVYNAINDVLYVLINKLVWPVKKVF